jgi:RNA polymerase sigma-70 factor (ECF subfamily)
VTDETLLLEQAKACDPAALEALYDRYASQMYAYIYRRVGNAALAEDLTGELFVRVLRAIQKERAWRISFRAWLYRIAHNLVIDHARRQPPVPHLPLEESLLPAPEGDPVDSAEESEAIAALRGALTHLTPDQQEVLALRFGEGLTAREVGQITKRTTGAVQALQHRALAALRRLLTKERAE